MDSANLNAMLVAASELSMESRWREAVAIARRVVEIAPSEYTAWWLLAQGYDHLQQDSEAVHAYREYFHHAPNQVELQALREFAASRAGIPSRDTDGQESEKSHPLVSFVVNIGGKRGFVQARNDSGTTLNAVLEAAEALIQSPNPFEAWLHAQGHRELFTGLADTVLTAMAQAQSNVQARTGVERYRDALRRVREGAGVAPFAEMARLSTDDFLACVTATDLQPALQELAQAADDAERDAVLAAHPEIVTDVRTLPLLRTLGGLQRDADAREGLQRLFTYIRNVRLGIPHLTPQLSPRAQAANKESRAALERRTIPTIDAALVSWRAVTEDDLVHRSAVAAGVATLHLARYDLAGDPTDLDVACSTLEKALQQDPDPHSPMLPYGYGVALLRRFEAAGSDEDLDRAIGAMRQALTLVVDGTHEEGAARSMLGAMLMRRGQRTGRISDLDDSVAALRLAVTADADAKGRVARLSNFGTACTERFQISGQIADLDEAEQAYLEALAIAPSEPSVMGALARVNRARFGITGDPKLLDRAIDAYRTVIMLPGAPLDLSLAQNNLASALRDRFLRWRDSADIDAAVDASRTAVRGLPSGHVHRPVWLENLGNSLRVRGDFRGSPADRAEAIATLEEALAVAQEGSQVWRTVPVNLGALLEEGDPERGLSLLELGFARTLAGPANDEVFNAALALARAYARRDEWPRAGEVLLKGMDAVERLQHAQLFTAAKKAWLAKSGDLHLAAAHALLLAGRVEDAVVALERGRGRLLGEVLGRDRAALMELERTGDHRILRRYRTAAEQVRMLAAAAERGERVREALAAATHSLDDMVDEVRRATGGAAFSHAPELKDIVAASSMAGAPLVYVAPLSTFGVAIIVSSSRPTLHSLVIPSLTKDGLNDQVERYVGAYRATVASSDDDGDWQRWQDTLDATSSWCWQTFMRDIVEALGEVGEAILIPVGQLGRLPLHAAAGGDKSCLDSVIWRYAPSARFLSQFGPTQADSILTVEYADADTPIPYISLETAAARQGFANQRILAAQEATVAAVLDEARQATVLHFACHATAAYEGDLSGGLALADGVLSVQDMADLRLASGSLVVLSACETGVISEHLPDEVLSIASGMLQSGASGVVSSLWSVPDVSTAILMGRFYFLWLMQGVMPAAALREAQRWLRDSTNGQIAAFLRDYLPTALVRELVEELESTPSDSMFAHCVHWGAFTYIGR